MDSVDDLIAMWPSMADLGRDMGLPYSTVAAWKQRHSIPVPYWRNLIDAAQRRGLRNVGSDLLIELHDQAAGRAQGGLAEAPVASISGRLDVVASEDAAGQFSRWKHARRSHFGTVDEIVDHLNALRSEWDRR